MRLSTPQEQKASPAILWRQLSGARNNNQNVDVRMA